MTISAELSGALRYCGDIREECIQLPDLWEFYLDSCATLDADLEISESWRQLTFREIDISEREQSLVSLENFSFEVGLDRRPTGTEDPWTSVDIVAPERVADAEGRGQAVASFYGQPRNVILSFDPANYDFRLWSVGTSHESRTEADEVMSLPGGATYAPLRKLLTAHKALPHCEHDKLNFERLEKVILRELDIWQPRWDRFKNKPLKREGSRRPGFKAFRRGMRVTR